MIDGGEQIQVADWSPFGVLFFGIGAVIAGVNFYLSFLRYPLHRFRGGTRENYRWVSGIPGVGSFVLWLSIVNLADHPFWMWSAFVISLLDTGGIPWFIGTMLWHWWRGKLG